MITAFLEISTQPGGFVNKIYKLTGGNPSHINEILRYMLENKILSFEQGNWWISDKDSFQKIPTQFLSILEKRYNRLSELQKNILTCAAFLNGEFSLSDLAQLTGKEPLILMDFIDELVRWKMLNRNRSNGQTFISFNHAIFRKLIFEKVRSGTRVELHLKAAHIMERHYIEGNRDLAGRLSYHYQWGGDREKAYDYALQAAGVAKDRLNYDEQAHYLEIVRALLPEESKQAQRSPVFEELGDAYYQSNQFAKALEVYQLTSSLVEYENNKNVFIRLVRKKGRILEKIGQLREAHDLYHTTLALCSDKDDSHELIFLRIQFAWIKSLLKEYKEALKLGRKALSLAKTSHDPTLLAYTYIVLGKISEDCEPLEKSMNSYRKALKLYRDTDNELGLASVFNNLGTVANKRGDWQRAVEYHKKSLTIKQKLSDLPGEADSLSNMAAAYGMHGDWDKSQLYFHHALNIFLRFGNEEGQSTIQHNLGELFLRKGEFRAAHRHLNRSIQLKEKLKDVIGSAHTYMSLAHLALRQSEFDAATDYLNRSQKIFKKKGLKRLLAINYRLFAEIYLKQGNLSYSLREINRAKKLIEAVGDPIEKGNVLRIYGEISEQLGDKKKAQNALEESMKILNEVGADFELGSTFLQLGKKYLFTDNLREAALIIDKAQHIFMKLGTPDMLAQVHELKRELNAKLQPYYFTLPSDHEQLKSLIRISYLLNSTKNLERLLKEILDIIIQTIKADQGAIFLKDNSTHQLCPEIVRNLEQETVDDAIQLSKTITDNVALKGEPIYITDTKVDSLCSKSQSVALYGIVAILCVPLKVYDELIGVVYLDSRSMADIFLEKDLHFIAAFANMAALAISNSMERNSLLKENNYFRLQSRDLYQSHNIVAQSKMMKNILKIVAKVASSSSTVLLTGESGTGKELIARAIHNMGTRSNKMFLPFFCGNAPETMIDSELFGHMKGAFTGAMSNKKGIFEEAEEGTVFLDEISEIGPQIQAKLLRFLQQKEIRPLGSTLIKEIDVRIVAASNKNLQEEVKKGRFREDLFYRLKVIHLDLPPLRKRREDIHLLAQHFLAKYNNVLNKNVLGITKKTMERLMDYSWPGNVRELENQIEYAVNLAENGSYIDESLLNDDVRNIDNVIKGTKMSGTLKDILSRLERELIVNALLENKGNKTRAARRLGVSRQCLNQKLKTLNIY